MERNLFDTFDALADPTRRQILIMLKGRHLAAGEIARCFPQQRPAISKHLSILKRAGLLNEVRQRQQRIYSIRRETLSLIVRLLESLIDDPTDKGRVIEAKRIPMAIARHEPPPRTEPYFDLEFD